jgi:hypothetical protein
VSEVLAGRGAVPELVRVETAAFRPAAGLGLLLVTLALMLLPAAIGALVLLRVVA